MSFLITSTAWPTPLTDGETATFTIRLSIASEVAVENVQEYVPRLTIGGSEVAIRACNWNKSRGAVGVDCGFTLADISDRGSIAPGSSLKFEVGIVPPGALPTDPEVDWRTIADLQQLAQRSFSISGDTFSFRSISGIADRLNTAPVTPFLMYDPEKAPYDPTTVETVYDTEGRAYPMEVIEVPNLSLYAILEEVIVNRCGFTDFDPNGIPDIAVPQFDVNQGESFLDALWAIVEPFAPEGLDGPLLTEKDDVIGLHDLSNLLPSGFPTPPDLTEFAVDEFSIDASYSDVVAARMVFSIPDDWDFATSRIEVTNLPEGDNLWKLTIKNIHELRSHYQPDIILDEREQFFSEYVNSLLGASISLDQTTKFFDKYARERTAITKRWFMEPGETSVNIFGPPTEEIQQITRYEQHPHKIGRQYQSKITRETTGKITVDSVNPYRGQPFRSQMRLAHWAGMAHEETTTETGLLRVQSETYRPQRNGQVVRKIFDHDHVRNLPIANRNEPAVGEISLNGAGARSREMIVTEDGSEYTGGRIIDIHVGSIPLEIAIPLVRRKLKRMRLLSQEARLSIVGFNPEIEHGYIFSASDKDFQMEGSFICVAFSGSGENLGTDQSKWSMSVEGVKV